MRKIGVILLSMLLLVGCSRKGAWETVSDRIVEGDNASKQNLCLALPEEAAQAVIADGEEYRIYFCDGYEVMVSSRESGDLDATLRWLTGFPRSALTVLATEEGAFTRYHCAWTCAGESGDQVCRAQILDDGNYHYAVCVMADSEDAGQYADAWDALFHSVGLGEYSAATS